MANVSRNIERRTQAVIDRHDAEPVSRVIEELEDVYRRVGDRLRALEPTQWSDESSMIPNFTVESYTALLALEIWTHADDIRLSVGRELRQPETVHLAAMTQVLPQWVSMVLSQTEPAARPSHYRLDLTGRAPSEFDIWPDANAAARTSLDPDVTITCDSIEFCKLAGARRTPKTFDRLATGDLVLAESFVSALADFALM